MNTVLVEVWIPFFLKRYDMEFSLSADVGDLLDRCLLWISEQKGVAVQKQTHFFCNPRTKEIIRKGTTLSETSVIRGDVLIIF